jgi:predicted glycoside hydrolase/deacetylase ChbG (UPF0249 family)
MPALPIILCADDFGFSPGVSEGILELAAKRRLSAVGCMMTQTDIGDSVSDLKTHSKHLDIGIHLVLTDLKALTPGLGNFSSIGTVARTAIMGQLSKAEIKTELALQLDTFRKLFNKAPDFIDGHHHIQQLPGIRDLLLELIKERFPVKPPFLRSCYERPAVILKRGISPIKALAFSAFALTLRRRTQARNIPTNSGFSGIYNFSGKIPYKHLFERFTEYLQSGTLIMCHPGKVDAKLRTLDRLTDQREVELAYFLSNDFTDLLQQKNLCLGRFTAATEQ